MLGHSTESTEPIEFKGTSLSVITALLRTTDPAVLSAALEKRLKRTPDFFSGDALVMDFSAIQPPPTKIDWRALTSLLRHYKLVPVAARISGPTTASARAAGLAVIEESDVGVRSIPTPPPAPKIEKAETEVVARAPAANTKAEPAVTNTLFLDKPLRSGQRLYARGGDLIVLAMVSSGAELIADGSIHVYAPLRGRAIAGAQGHQDARIISTCFDAELVSIAGVYRTFEKGVPADVARKPAQVKLSGQGENQTLLLETLNIT